MIPKYPFRLTIHWSSGQAQVKSFETCGAAIQAGGALRPALVRHWEISVVLESKTLDNNNDR